MLIALKFLLSTASAADTQTTAISGQVEVNVLGTLMAKQQALEAELAQRQAACPVAAPCPTTAPAPKPKTSSKAKVVAVPAPIVPDPKVAELERQIAELKVQIAAIPAPLPPTPAYDDTALSGRVQALEQKPAPVIPAPYDDKALTDRVVALETAPPAVVTHTIVDYRSGFNPIAYVGASGVVAGPVSGVSDVVSGRLQLGVRPQWNIDERGAFGLTVEGDSALGGWGIRGIPTYLIYGSTGGWGLGAGVGYNCDGLGEQGCMAEHTGAIGRISWEKGGSFAGFLGTIDFEANYLAVNGASGSEFRVVVGGNVYFGNPRPKGY